MSNDSPQSTPSSQPPSTSSAENAAAENAAASVPSTLPPESVRGETGPGSETGPGGSPSRRIRIGSQRDGFSNIKAKPQVVGGPLLPLPGTGDDKPTAGTDKPLSGDKPSSGDRSGAEKPTGEKAGADKGKPRKSGQPDDEEEKIVKSSASAPPVPRDKVSIPNIREKLSDDLEIQMAEALALSGQSVDDLMKAAGAAAPRELLAADTRLRARVIKIHQDNVFVDLKQSSEGVLPLRQFEDQPPKIGDFIDVAVERFVEEEGLYYLHRPHRAVDAADWEALSEGIIIEGTVTAVVKGGLECKVGQIRGFIPASQVSLLRIEDFSGFLNQKLRCVVTECKPQRKNLVLSHRAVLEREREEAREKLLTELAEGQTREGIVRNVKDFGAFVDLGGVDGLLPVGQLSWARVKHPSDLLQPGQKVTVKIQRLEPETKKITLSMRDLQTSPWSTVPDKYPPGRQLRGKVTKVMQFGAFVELEPGIEGLIHISELSHQHIWRVTDIVQPDQEVEVQVMSLDLEKQRIALSYKATQPAPVKGPSKSVEDEPAEEVVVPKKKQGPLKGGLGGGQSGTTFGLNW